MGACSSHRVSELGCTEHEPSSAPARTSMGGPALGVGGFHRSPSRGAAPFNVRKALACTRFRPFCWRRGRIPIVRFSFSRSASRLSARRQDLYQICGECSERLAWASSRQASLVGMRLAASMRAARAGWPRSSKSSSAVCNSNRFAPWRRASSRAAPMSARRASGRVVEDLHLAPRRHARARHQPLF